MTTTAIADNSAQESRGFSVRAPVPAAAKAPASAVVVAASEVFHNAQYGTGGVALRNRAGGSLNVSGVTGLVQAAYIYWAVIVTQASSNAVKSITLQRSWPNPMTGFVTLTGTLVGVGSTPCWGGSAINVYRASVPLDVASGNGSYLAVPLSGASGRTGGEDPWAAPVTAKDFPLFEGASLVMVGTGTSTVALYDSGPNGSVKTGLAGRTLDSGNGFSLNYTLVLPSTVGKGPVLFDNIGADGQFHGATGTSRNSQSSISDEVTTVNGMLIAGPGSPINDGDWNGSSGLPIPQLWDDTGHDITSAAPAGTSQLNFTISAAGTPKDCATPVANIVSFN